MRALRFVSLAILAIWIGGLVALGAVAAPRIFEVIETHDPATGATLAGAVFGAVLESFLRLTYALGAALAFTLAARAALGQRPRAIIARLTALGLMVAASALTGLVIAPRIDAIRESTPQPITALAATDPRRVTFGRLHGASGGLLLVTVSLGCWLLWMDARDDAPS